MLLSETHNELCWRPSREELLFGLIVFMCCVYFTLNNFGFPFASYVYFTHFRFLPTHLYYLYKCTCVFEACLHLHIIFQVFWGMLYIEVYEEVCGKLDELFMFFLYSHKKLINKRDREKRIENNNNKKKKRKTLLACERPRCLERQKVHWPFFLLPNTHFTLMTGKWKL